MLIPKVTPLICFSARLIGCRVSSLNTFWMSTAPQNPPPPPPHNKSQSLSDKIIMKSSQIQMSQTQLEQQLNAHLKALQLKHKQSQQIIDQKISFPVKLCGTNDKYETRYSYLLQRIMGYYRLPWSAVNEHLLKMWKGSLYAIADCNNSYMQEYWEKTLKDKTLKALEETNRQNMRVSVQKNVDYLDEVGESCQIIDAIMVRGLSIDRQLNQAPSEYLKYSQADDVGLITYTPKHVTDNNQNFIDPRKNKKVYEGYDRMLLRVLVRIKSPLKLNVTQVKVPENVYTWEHLCVFQNQMVASKPLESGYKIETYMEWLGKYRFGAWKLVDIDNFMEGNSPFGDKQKKVEMDPVFKGTRWDKTSFIDIRTF